MGQLSARVSMKGTLWESYFSGEPFFFFLEPEDWGSFGTLAE